MSLKENKKIIQDIYDKGLFQGISYSPKENKIFVAVRDGKGHKMQEIKTEYPPRDFEALKEYVQNLKFSKAEDIDPN